VSNVIRELDPDILNLCEVEGCDELNMLVSDLDRNYKPYLKKGTDSSTGQNVGMITRVDPITNLYRTENRYNYPIAGSKCGYTGAVGSSGVSKHYITEFNISGTNIAFISAHLLAYPTDPERCAEREAQAMVLQAIIIGYISKKYEVIMLGDFNDFDAQILDVNSNRPLSHVLDILKGLYGDYAGKYTLYSISETVAQQYRFSDWYDSDNNCNTDSENDYSVLDHILVTSKLQSKIVNAFFYHGYDEYCGTYNSDHYPVVIDLLL
jgi:endonuclease/exonuclease/phosphatase family metal-dependent hydrolase